MPLAGRQGARARTVLGTGPEGEARRRPRGVLPRRERTGAGEGSGQAGGPDGFPGPPDCREGADKTVRLRRGCEGPESQHAEDAHPCLDHLANLAGGNIGEVLATHTRSMTSWGTSSVLQRRESAGVLLQVLQAVRFVEAAGEVRPEDCIGYSRVLDNFLREHEISGDHGDQGKEGQSTKDHSHGPLRPGVGGFGYSSARVHQGLRVGQAAQVLGLVALR